MRRSRQVIRHLGDRGHAGDEVEIDRVRDQSNSRRRSSFLHPTQGILEDEEVDADNLEETDIDEPLEPEIETQEATPESEQDALDDEEVEWQDKEESTDDDTWAVGW